VCEEFAKVPSYGNIEMPVILLEYSGESEDLRELRLWQVPPELHRRWYLVFLSLSSWPDPIGNFNRIQAAYRSWYDRTTLNYQEVLFIAKDEWFGFLRRLGVECADSTYSHRGPSGGSVTEWRVSVLKRPIREVIVRYQTNWSMGGGGSDKDDWSIRYVIMSADVNEPMKLSLRQEKDRTIKATNRTSSLRQTRTEADAFAEALTNRLTSESAMNGRHVSGTTIGVEAGQWVICPNNSFNGTGELKQMVGRMAPTREQWETYQAIARVLAETLAPM
jgi:hypothetical protein